jgi:hypothetical protein
VISIKDEDLSRLRKLDKLLGADEPMSAASHIEARVVVRSILANIQELMRPASVQYVAVTPLPCQCGGRRMVREPEYSVATHPITASYLRPMTDAEIIAAGRNRL